jgi:hypothetical protein
MRIVRRLLLVLATLALASCAALRAAPEPPRQRPLAQQDPEYLVDKEKLDEYAVVKDPVEKKLLRNEIIDERLLEADTQFQKYEIALWQQGVGAGIGTDWVQLAIAGATATAGGASTKSVLGAVSAFITGSKASFDKNAFFEKTLAAVVAQMVGEREKMRAAIAFHKQLPISDYSLFEALSEIKKFIIAGTIPGAIQAIAVDAGEKTAKANADLESVLVVTAVPPALQARREKAAKIVKEDLSQSELDELAKSLGLAPGAKAKVDILTIIAGAQTSQAFDRFAQKLKIVSGKEV